MAETMTYEVDGYKLRFTAEDDPFKGTLVTEFPDSEEVCIADIDLPKLRSRNQYSSYANKLYGVDRQPLEKALNTLCSLIREEVAAAEESAEQQADPEQEFLEVSEAEIEKRLGRPGVLDQLAAAAAACSGAVGDLPALKLIALGALSAQLALLPNGKPMTANVIVSAGASRGKNYLCDAVANILPSGFYFPFESSSAKAFYYMAQDNPAFLKHCWVYPNEAEGVDDTIEMFRPLLSGGEAKHKTVNKDARGSNAYQEFTIQGPVALAVPTVRNKLDTQLQTRMLILGLEDYEGRVAAHSRAVSALLSPDYVNTDHTEEAQAWQAALHTLTGVRRVVLPVDRDEFRFSSDEVSHGARLWSNLLALMCAHAWLEQRNREIRDLPSGERAIEASPEDYEAVYGIFEATCERSIVNLSEMHRKILDAVYWLHEQKEANSPFDENRDEWDESESTSYEGAFSQKQIAKISSVPQSTISDHKTFLVKSVKFLQESREGLSLVDGVVPSDWQKDDVLTGFPSPRQVREWWTAGDGSPSPDTPGRPGHSGTEDGEHLGQPSDGDRGAAGQGSEAPGGSGGTGADRWDDPNDRERAGQEKGIDKQEIAAGRDLTGTTGDFMDVMDKLSEEDDRHPRADAESDDSEDEWADDEPDDFDLWEE